MFLFSGGCPSAYIKQSLSIHSISGTGRKPVKKIPASATVLLTMKVEVQSPYNRISATICRFRTRYRSSPQSQTTPLQARPLPILQRLLYAWHNSPWLSSPYPHEHACTLRLSLFPLLPYSSPHLAFHVIAIMQVIYIA